jgi:hypothetical protein
VSGKTLYLHLGMDKTGTSALQYFLHSNSAELMREMQLCYPTTGLWNDYSHHPFAFSLVDLYGYSATDLPGLFRSLGSEIEKSENVLLSSECLFKTPLKDSFSVFWQEVSAIFDAVKVIVYVRRQDHWVESRHKHSIISGSELSLEMLQRPGFCDYKQFIDRWAELVGRENTTVRAYEKQQYVGGSIFSDFLSVLGLRFDERYRLPARGLNVSLGRDETFFKKLCNEMGFVSAGADGLNRALIERAKVAREGAPGEVPLLSPVERASLVARYAEVNSAIAKEYMGRDDGVLFMDPLPDPGEQWDRYDGLSSQAAAGILLFIRKHDPETFKLLGWAVRSALKSSEQNKVSAARTLHAALQAVE